MKNIILFDIDLCIIDTNKIRKRIRNRFLKLTKMTKNNYRLIHNNYYKTLRTSKDFKPETFCRYFAEHTKSDYLKLIGIFYSEKELYKNSFFDDVLPALNKLANSYVLGIFSEGFKKYQITKLKHSGLLPFFNKKHIYIRRNKLSKASLEALPKNVTLVDDKLNVITTLKKYGYPVIWINRVHGRYVKGIKTVNSLSEL